MLCMRLALIDALFKQEKPFVLLDDPFVNLDDEHTERALEMLKEIAKNKQVPAVKSSDEFAKEKTLPVKKREGSL